ncbi:MAG: sugar phosphate nucleotidyltransferase [Alphaproteobacteria bacterium]
MIVITDFTGYACSRTTPIREVLNRLDRTPHLFQIVLDDDGRLLGTITDGDVRRAMLRGVELDGAAAACMQPQPKTGRKSDPQGNVKKLADVGSSRAFLPVVDDDGRMVEILVREPADAGIARALVMAGGYGTRLGERTRNTPKPLLEVGGRPILDHVLSGLEKAGVSAIHVSVHYRAEQIRAYLEQRDNRVPVALVEESEPMGTAGALAHIGGPGRAPLLVVNGDLITDVDFAALHEFHLRHALDGTIGVARYDIDVPFGVIRYGEDGLFAGIEEKPRISNFIAAGVYYLSAEFMALVPHDRPMDMPELLNQGRKIGLRIGLFPIHEYWTDVGRPADLDAANAAHRNRTVDQDR